MLSKSARQALLVAQSARIAARVQARLLTPSYFQHNSRRSGAYAAQVAHWARQRRIAAQLWGVDPYNTGSGAQYMGELARVSQ